MRVALVVLTLLVGAATAVRATDVPIVGLKLIVIDKGSGGKAKAVFVAKDVAITKGTGTDPTQIEAKIEVEYDDASGAFVMPQGPSWTANKATVSKYANKTAPTGGVVKVGIIKPGTSLKLVGRGLGDTPLDISTAPTGDVYVAATIVNGGEETRLCTRFSDCTHKSIAGGTGFKLLCKGSSTGDPGCNAAAARCPTAPPAPVGGSYATCTTDIPSGATCALTCADGYTHTGTDPTCTDGAFVGAATCEPASCAPLTAPFISSDCGTASTGGTCTVQCAPGMQRSDGGVGTSVTATCTGTAPGSSTWTHPTFTCAPPPCLTAPSAVTGGSYPGCATTPIASGQTCTLACADGYSHVGTDPTCQSGSFVGSATCEPAACAPLVEPNITTNCATGAIGNTCNVQCAPGHQRSDGGVGTSVTATCSGIAPGVSTWTHPTFTCEPDPCTVAFPPPAGGSYPSCTPPVPSGQSCPLVCANGYSHSGGTDPTCSLGAYVGGTSTCVPATCAPVAEPYVSSNCGTATTGNSCTLQCASGSHRTDGGTGSSVTGTCTGVGTGASVWTHPTFTCGPDPCPSAPIPPVGGSYPGCAAPPIASGTTCVLACANGYSPSGTNPTCSSGTFDGNTPTCVPATCAPLNEPGISPLCGTGTTGGTCTVRCQPGYHRSDGGVGTSVTGTCTGIAQGASAWTHPTFTCEPDQCTAPFGPAPAGGSYCTPPVPSGTTCPLACANGYSHTGTDPDCYLGFYNGSTADCVPATCAPLAPPPPFTPPFTQSNCAAAPTGATCTVQCQPGNIRNDGGGPPNSSVTATCTGTGPGTSVWTHPTFTCIGQPCVAPPNPPAGGSFPTCTTGPIASGTDCFVECANGYTAPDNRVSCYIGSYNGTATCGVTMGAADPPLATFCGDGACRVLAPAGVLALDGAAGLNGAALLPTVIAALQMLRRRRRR